MTATWTALEPRVNWKQLLDALDQHPLLVLRAVHQITRSPGYPRGALTTSNLEARKLFANILPAISAVDHLDRAVRIAAAAAVHRALCRQRHTAAIVARMVAKEQASHARAVVHPHLFSAFCSRGGTASPPHPHSKLCDDLTRAVAEAQRQVVEAQLKANLLRGAL